MHICCLLWSLIYRKLNDSATVALFWHMLSLYSIEVLDRRFFKISHSAVKQNCHSFKNAHGNEKYSMKWTLCHPVAQSLRSWWNTHRFKIQPSTSGSEDPHLASSLRKLTESKCPPLDLFSLVFVRTFYEFFHK